MFVDMLGHFVLRGRIKHMFGAYVDLRMHTARCFHHVIALCLQSVPHICLRTLLMWCATAMHMQQTLHAAWIVFQMLNRLFNLSKHDIYILGICMHINTYCTLLILLRLH